MLQYSATVLPAVLALGLPCLVPACPVEGQTPGAADALKPPPIRTRPAPEYAPAGRGFQGIPGIERSAGGRFWATWYAGGDGEGEANYVVLATSGDNGTSWSEPILVIDPPGPVRAYDPCLWHDPEGRLWLFWAQSYQWWDGRAGVWAIVTEDSDAAEPRWSEPRRLADGIMMNKPTVLSTGEWLMLAAVWERPATADPAHRHDLGSRRGANVLASRDRGASWESLGQAIVPDRVFDEHMIVERRDGSLWMLVRAAYGIGESVSTDRGRTWSPGRKSSIPHVNSRFFIRRLASGRLLLVTHEPPDGKTRSHLIARLSDDDGRTWQGGLTIDERPGVSYPDGVQAPDGTIHLIHDFDRTGKKQILLAQFREEDVLAGAFRSAGSRARIPVSDPQGDRASEASDRWERQAREDATHDRTTVLFDGITPNRMACDTTLRAMPDGSWVLVMLAGGDTEPAPENYTAITRSTDQGATWEPLRPLDVGFPRSGDTRGQGPTELLVHRGRCTLFFSTHAETWGVGWRSWMIHSEDSGRSWSAPEPAPGRLANATFLRSHIVTADGRILVPFQHYLGPPPGAPAPEDRMKRLAFGVSNPRNGVLMSHDGGRTWTEHGDIRLTDDDRYHGWAENALAELSDGRIVMLIRGDRLGGVLYRADSPDGGRTWPDFASRTDIPNPGSKATLYPLGGDAVALLHNPNPQHRSPLALWISFDGMATWPYRRVLVAESSDGPKGRLNYPDGFVSADRQYLHFAYDDNRHRAVYYGAKLPPLPPSVARTPAP